MKKSIAMKWVQELRSGKWKQTTHKLKEDGGAMCCLGVLETKVLGVKYKKDGNGDWINEDGQCGEITNSSQEIAGMRGVLGPIMFEGE